MPGSGKIQRSPMHAPRHAPTHDEKKSHAKKSLPSPTQVEAHKTSTQSIKEHVRVLRNQPRVEQACYPGKHDLESKRAIAEKFQVGDVVFTRLTKTFAITKFIDMWITFAQKIINLIEGKKDKANLYRITHAAIVVEVGHEKGIVKLAEAMPTGKKNELRIIDLLSDHSAYLEKSNPFEYIVLRINKDKDTAEHAAEIATRLATPASYLQRTSNPEAQKGEHKFSFLKGLIAIFNKSSGHIKSKTYAKRLFKLIADEHLKMEKATGEKRDRSFFCSYFTAHVFQQAELSKKLEEIKKLTGVSEGLKSFESLQGSELNEEILIWARKMARVHGKAINKVISSFKLDPKHTSPQALIKFLTKKDLFTPVLNIVPMK